MTRQRDGTQKGSTVPTAVLGLSEAGARYAADLTAAGWQVTGYAPAPTPTPGGVTRAHSVADAVLGADLALSFTGEQAAIGAAAEASGALPTGACYADFNTAAPATKRAVQGACGVALADVAVLAPAPRAGVATPLIVSGDGADDVAGALRSAGAPVEVLAEPAGAAAGRKLLRSVFMKGLADAVIEADTAGTAAGCQQWVREQMAGESGPRGAELIERLIEGTHAHTPRRLHEMRASREYLDELGVRTPVVEAGLAWLRELTSAEREESNLREAT